MKKILLILLISLIFASCSSQKQTVAYCFTMVFEKDNDTAKVTLYCKAPDKSENGKMKAVNIATEGKNFKEALNNISGENYEVYSSSIISYYLSGNLHEKDINEISCLLLESTSYKTDNYVYSNKKANDIQQLHKQAKRVCTDEQIQKKDKKNYTKFLKQIRKLTLSDKKVNLIQ